MKLYAYAQNTTQAGRVVAEDYVEDPESDDYICYEGTEDALIDQAWELLKNMTFAGSGTDIWMRRVASGILDHIGAHNSRRTDR